MKVISTRPSGVFNEADEWCEGWEVFVSFTEAEIQELLAAYDPLSGTSPSVADARPVLRAILDKILEEA